ncbi:hypothetical protein [Streptomyces sp. NPDC013455]|uniref:NHL domain-containing protein n=1 Tax=Streptomyces sp. NPDC013455 TaxID=3155605 RepID=UPI0033DCBC89
MTVSNGSGTPRPALADGVVVTIAGTGQPGYGGDGGPAAKAMLNQPRALAVDPASGAWYVAEWKGHRVRRIAADGTITTYAGTGEPGYGGDGGPADRAPLHEPGGLVVAPDGALYVADYWNHRIRRVDRDGIITTVAGTGEPGYGGDGGPAVAARFTEPRGLALDAEGTLYVAEWGGHRVRAIGADGMIRTVAGTGDPGSGPDAVPGPASALHHPIDLAVDADGRLYIADCFSHRIRVVEPDGVIRTVAGTGEPGSGEGRLHQPRGVDLGEDGSLYIADSLNERVCVRTSDGVLHTLAGGPPHHEVEGGPALGARLRLPRALVLAGDGSLIVGETDNHRVRLVTCSQ